jgi:uncharacterized membrane protein YqaE (UPF0057 family)
MNKNWILLLFAIIGLASCSIEKRVYQPGYHIEWNHYAVQDVSQGASQDLPQELSENLETDVSQGRSEGASQDLFQDAAQGRSEGATQDLFQDAVQGRSEGASRDLSENLPENLETDVSHDLSRNINSDLEFVLLIILALFLPALTVFLLEGFSKNFWIALLLMAIAYLLPFSSFIIRGLIVAIATILAIAVVFHYM